MPITEEMIRNAMLGAAVANNGELFASYEGIIPDECTQAAITIYNNLSEFEHLVLDKLSTLPYTREYFGRLLRIRLKQNGILASPLISMVFDPTNKIEQRLERIRNIPGVKRLKKEYRTSKDPQLGTQTDDLARDLLAEILVVDFLVLLCYTNIEKLPDLYSKPHIDILARKDVKSYAIDVTRKKEISSWHTLPFSSLEDCNDIDNQLKVRELITKVLNVKDDQFLRAVNSSTFNPTYIKTVAIKSSDYGFAECINQAVQISNELLATRNWTNVDCIWLVPNVEVGDSRWIFR